MTKRLVFGDNPLRFKLSRPTVEVDTANYDDLLFDISLGRVSGIFMSGVVARTALTLVTVGTDFYGSTYLTYRITINYGRTFVIPPQIFLYTRDPLLTNDGHVSPKYFRAQSNFTRFAFIYAFPGTASFDIILSTKDVNFTLPATISYLVMRI